MEKNYNREEPPSNKEECIRLTVKALLEVVQTGAKNIEITVVEPNNQVRALTNEEIAKYVETIEQEKQQEQERRKAKSQE